MSDVPLEISSDVPLEISSDVPPRISSDVSWDVSSNVSLSVSSNILSKASSNPIYHLIRGLIKNINNNYRFYDIKIMLDLISETSIFGKQYSKLKRSNIVLVFL